MSDNNTGFLEQPVFISGFNKSGTTLLLSLLDNHEELVVIPEELHFFQNVLFSESKPEAIKEKTCFRMFLSNDYLKEWSRGKSWYKDGYPEFDTIKFSHLIKEYSGEENPKRLLVNYVRAFAETDGKPMGSKKRWVSKTTQDEIFFPIIKKMFVASTPYIYVVRDPRDVYASFKKRDVIAGRNEDNLERFLKFVVKYKTQLNMALYFQKRFKNFIVLKYEDIIIRTESIMRKLAKFLDIQFSQTLLQPTRHGKDWQGNSVYSENFRELSKEPIGRHKKHLPEDERVLIEKLINNEMKAFNYEVGYQKRVPQDIILSKKVIFGYTFAKLLYSFSYKLKQRYLFLRFRFQG